MKYRLYWLDGKTNVVEGRDIAEAMNNAGYGGGSVRALDFYDTTEAKRFEWDTESRRWYNPNLFTGPEWTPRLNRD